MGTAVVPAGSDCPGVAVNVASEGLVPHSNQAMAALPPGVTLPFSVALVPVTADAADVATVGGPLAVAVKVTGEPCSPLTEAVTLCVPATPPMIQVALACPVASVVAV